MSVSVGRALDHLQERKTRYVEQLCDWLRIPSISTDPKHLGDMAEAADWTIDHLEGIGCRQAEKFGSESHPAVFGELRARQKGASTVLIYGHYDVQPSEPDGEWASDAFEPTLRGERLYARGTADMKGPAFSALCALDALTASDVGLGLNVKILLEGEEEIGSPQLEGILETHRSALESDFCLNLDAGMLAEEHPTLSVSVRGIATFDLRITGPSKDLHSGEFGGVVHNPAQVLCDLLSRLHDTRGRVNLEGFYERVRELDAEERALLARLPVDEAFFLSEAGVEALWGEAGYTVLERIGVRPTLDIHGLTSGFSGQGSKTIVPSSASAKLSMRLVPDQDPDEVAQQLERYLREHAPPTVSWQLDAVAGVPPAECDVNSRWSLAMREALRTTWGSEPLVKRVGGTIPVVGLLQRTLGVDSVNIGWALPDGNLHAPNENLHVPTFFKGTEALIRFLSVDPARG